MKGDILCSDGESFANLVPLRSSAFLCSVISDHNTRSRGAVPVHSNCLAVTIIGKPHPEGAFALPNKHTQMLWRSLKYPVVFS
jgi:hypothetical protein